MTICDIKRYFSATELSHFSPHLFYPLGTVFSTGEVFLIAPVCFWNRSRTECHIFLRRWIHCALVPSAPGKLLTGAEQSPAARDPSQGSGVASRQRLHPWKLAAGWQVIKMNNKRQHSLLTHWEWFLSLTLTLWKCYVYADVTHTVSIVAALFRIWGSHQVRQTWCWCCYFSHLKREILSQCGLLTLGNSIHNMLRNTCKEEGQVSLGCLNIIKNDGNL